MHFGQHSPSTLTGPFSFYMQKHHRIYNLIFISITSLHLRISEQSLEESIVSMEFLMHKCEMQSGFLVSVHFSVDFLSLPASSTQVHLSIGIHFSPSNKVPLSHSQQLADLNFISFLE